MNVKKRTTQTKRIIHAVLALILLLGSMLNAIPVWAGSTSSVWSPVSSLPTGNTLSGAIYGNGIYVAVGSGGTILTSTSGTDSWVSHDSGATDLNGVACGVDGNGSVLFAAVGNGGTILTSADGTAWVSRTSGTAADLKGITYGGGQFAAVGNGGTILTSADGVTWTSITNSGTPYTASALNGITCGSDGNGGNIFVAVGNGGTILTSPDGETWSDYSNSTVSTADLFGAAYGLDSNGDGLFSAVGSNGTILTSADGTAWTTAANPVPAANLKGITYGGGQFVAVGDGGTILASAGGATWTLQTSGTSNSLYGVACGSNYYVAVGQNGTMLYYALAPAAGAAVITSVRDIGSQGNGSDLEVSFDKAADESLVSEYRIMVVPIYEAANFNVIKANAIPAGSYTAVNKTGSNITTALANSATDIDGSLIENDSTYKVFILSVADGVNATVNTLSGASSEITLRMWNWANPKPTGNTFNGTAYGNSLYVAVGASGGIFNSPDGTNWTNCTSETDYDLYGVTYGKGIFVAIGDMGSAVTSPDGTHWTHNDNASNILDPGAGIKGVAYGKGLFVAVCSDGNILTSPDGVTWISRVSGAYLSAVAYGNGYFAAVGDSGKIMISSDGRTWTSVTNSGTPYTTEDFYGITYGGSGFVAVGTNGLIMYSSTGVFWTSATANYMGSTYPVDSTIMAVTYGNGRYLSMVNGIILTSFDGATWTVSLSAPTANTYGLTYGNALFLAAGDNGIITLSPDGAIWTRRSSGTVNYIKGVVYDGSRFIAVGNGVTLDSADGASWDSHSIAADYGLNGVTYGKDSANQDIYVAVGSNGYPNGDQGIIMTSADRAAWSLVHTRSDGNTPLASVAYGNGAFVAVGRNNQSSGDYGVILTSPDGSNWTSQGDGSTTWARLYSVVYGNGRFVAVGYEGIILTSTDGTSWTVTQPASTSAETLNGISYVNSTFVAVGYGGRIIYSADGAAWNTLTDSRTSAQLYGVTYNDGVYVAVGESGTIRTSTDLTNWTGNGCDPGTKNIFYGVSRGNGVYVAVGSDGTILTSGTAVIATPTTANAANNTVSVSPASVTTGSSVTITAAGDRQSVAGAVYGDERYIPSVWTSTEAGKNGTFTLSGGNYTSSYTPASAGSCTITATFQKQTWNGSAWNNAVGSIDTKTASLTVTAASVPTTANASNNTISVNPASVTTGSSVTITATGDRQSVVGAVYDDERYIPITWTSTEAGENGTFTVTGSTYTSSYTPASAGSYTITATFQKQTWNGSAWNNAVGSTDTKTASLTVTTASVPTTANASNNTISVNPASIIRGNSTTVTAAGDRQSVTGEVYGDERYIPTTWTSTEAGKNGTFTVTGSTYTSSYTPASAGSYTITATFQKQTWNGSAWNNVVGSIDIKTASLTVNGLSGSGGGSGGGGGYTPSPASTTITGSVIDGTTGAKISNLTATVTTDSNGNGNATISLNAAQIIMLKQPDGNISPLSDMSQVAITTSAGSPVAISPDGTIQVANLAKGTDNNFKITHDLGNGQTITIGTMEIKVASNGAVTLTSTLIDPYGIITDAATGKSLESVKVILYYADSARNRAAGKTPDTVVTLPGIAGFKLNDNQNPQTSDVNGAYGFMVFPATDYYIVASKDGYAPYTSPTISVEQEIFKWDFKMSPTTSGATRLAGRSRVDTALAIAIAEYPGKIANVILATADNYPDALAGSVLAYKVNAPILLVGSSAADQEKVLDYLKSSLDPEGTVYILGGTAAVGSAMENEVAASEFTHIIRIAGADRYETSVKIADQLAVKAGTPLVLVSGENYPDALSISSVAAQKQFPILLVQKNGISDGVRQEIAAIKPTKVYIIGGEGVISPTVANQVAQITGLPQTNIVRIGGADRYATSLATSQYFNLAGQNVCIATGDNFPDALAGSVYAANHNAPIILADGSLSDQVMNYLKGKKLTGAILFGGEAAVSKDIEQQLEQLIGQ